MQSTLFHTFGGPSSLLSSAVRRSCWKMKKSLDESEKWLTLLYYSIEAEQKNDEARNNEGGGGRDFLKQLLQKKEGREKCDRLFSY